MRTIAIVVSAGKGTRFGGRIPKQYIEINNRPVVCRTLGIFNLSPAVNGIILVTAKNKIKYCRQLVKCYNLKKILDVVEGGRTRAHSVYNGLKAVPKETEIVIIHDAVRPFLKQKLIKKTIKNAKKYGAVITAIMPKDTIKERTASGFVRKTFIREGLVNVQTPQAFKYDMLLKCYEKFKNRLDEVTDDSSLVEMSGHKVKVIEGCYDNIKITTNEDLKHLRNNKRKAHAIGIGYDIHRLEKGRRLVLGGVEIPSKFGLLGHSDSDVLLHAVTDAILGAIGERDIGWHFPNNDIRYKGIASSFFILKAKKLMEASGFKVLNIDSTIVAQEPRLQPYYKRMIGNISNWLNINKKNITVKFTTPEKLGPLGHRKGIAGLSVVSLARYN